MFALSGNNGYGLSLDSVYGWSFQAIDGAGSLQDHLRTLLILSGPLWLVRIVCYRSEKDRVARSPPGFEKAHHDQRVREPHFCAVDDSIPYGLDYGEDIVICGIEDDALDGFLIIVLSIR